MLEIKVYCFSSNERETYHCYESCLGSKWLCVPVFRERASAQSQALGQIHLQLNCIRKVKCSARCYFSGITSVAQSTVSSLAPIAILLTVEPTGCKEQLNSCRQWLLAHLFLKDIFTWVFIYFFWWRFVFTLFWFPIYVISTRH